MGLMLNLAAASPSVIWTNTPMNGPFGAISKMMFLFGSERSTLLTNITGRAVEDPFGIERDAVPVDQPRRAAERVGRRVSRRWYCRDRSG